MNLIPKILVIDDEEIILNTISSSLRFGEYDVITCNSAQNAMEFINELTFDAIITDINMPNMSGLEFLEYVRSKDEYLPVILITGQSNSSYMMSAIKLGAYDFLRKPFGINELMLTVKQAVQKRRLQLQNEEYRLHLEEMVKIRTQELALANLKLEENMINTIASMINALEASDKYTRGHSERVTTISLAIAQKLDLDAERLKVLRLGALLHDIGKIGIYHTILNKPGKLTDDEFKVIRQHPEIGYKIVNPIEFEQEIFDIILQHHEKIDGSGYPKKIGGNEINLLAKIVAIADSYDAMTSDRIYRPNLTHEEAVAEISRHAGSQFDGAIVQIFLKLSDSFPPFSTFSLNDRSINETSLD